MTGEKISYGAKPCMEVLPNVPKAFWESVEGAGVFNTARVYCPDTDLLTLQYQKKVLRAYVASCSDVKQVLRLDRD